MLLETLTKAEWIQRARESYAKEEAENKLPKSWIVSRQNSLRGKQWPKLRLQVLIRDNYTCQYCGATKNKHDWMPMEVDHVIPCSKGGKTVLSNLKTSCFKCNTKKRSK